MVHHMAWVVLWGAASEHASAKKQCLRRTKKAIWCTVQTVKVVFYLSCNTVLKKDKAVPDMLVWTNTSLIELNLVFISALLSPNCSIVTSQWHAMWLPIWLLGLGKTKPMTSQCCSLWRHNHLWRDPHCHSSPIWIWRRNTAATPGTYRNDNTK